MLAMKARGAAPGTVAASQASVASPHPPATRSGTFSVLPTGSRTSHRQKTWIMASSRYAASTFQRYVDTAATKRNAPAARGQTPATTRSAAAHAHTKTARKSAPGIPGWKALTRVGGKSRHTSAWSIRPSGSLKSRAWRRAKRK